MQQNQTEWGLQSGVQFQIMDYAQMNQLFAFALLGEDSVIQMGYTNDMFTPSLNYLWWTFPRKNTQGFLLDADSDPTTTADQGIYELKRTIMQNFGGGSVSYTWNGVFNTSFGVSGYDFSIKRSRRPSIPAFHVECRSVYAVQLVK